MNFIGLESIDHQVKCCDKDAVPIYSKLPIPTSSCTTRPKELKDQLAYYIVIIVCADYFKHGLNESIKLVHVSFSRHFGYINQRTETTKNNKPTKFIKVSNSLRTANS